MEFAVEFYETENGHAVVEEEMEAIEQRSPVLYDLLVTGLVKLRKSENHRPPLCKPLGNDLFELRVGRKDIGRAVWFFRRGQRIVVVRCFVKKSQEIPQRELGLAWSRMKDHLRRYPDS